MFIGLSEAQHGLLLLHCCGNLLPDELPTTRTDLAHTVWDTLQELGTVHGIWHVSVKFQLMFVFRILKCDIPVVCQLQCGNKYAGPS